MAKASSGDPRIDERFTHDLSNLIAHVELFVHGCMDTPTDGSRPIVHNLGQRESREGVVGMDMMVSLLTALRGRLFQRNDICNEQGRGGLKSAINKLKEDIAGG